MDEVDPKMLIHEFVESLSFGLGERIHTCEGWFCTFLNINFEVVRSVRRKGVSFRLAEDIVKLVIVFRDGREVDRLGSSGSSRQ